MVNDYDTTRDCILYSLSQAEDPEERDYYWNLLETADFAEDYEDPYEMPIDWTEDEDEYPFF